MLEGADAVVHSMGILLEADYKGVLTGKESVATGFKRAFSERKGGSKGDPLSLGEEGELRSAEQDGQITYELMNRDSGMCATLSFFGEVWECRIDVSCVLCSNHARPRSVFPQCSLLRLHISSSWRPDATQTVYHHETRC